MSMSEFSRALVTITYYDLKSLSRCLIRRRTLNDLTLGRTRAATHANSYPHFISSSLHDCEMKLSNFTPALALWST